MIKRVARIACVLLWAFSTGASAKKNFSRPTDPNTNHVVLANDNQRYLCVALLNTTEGDQQGLDVIREAAKQGCNAAMITVRWDVVHEKTNSAVNWRQYDNQIQLCKELGLKIFIRVHLARCCNRSEGYWTEAEAAIDEQGRTLKDVFSMAHQPSVNKALGFVKEVCERYVSHLQEDRILCIAATTTPTQEAGYHYVNTVPNTGNTYLTYYDFTPSMLTGYRSWLQARYGGDIKKINEAWKSDYSDINDIQPVKTDYPHPENKRWSDWYIYRHSLLKNFLDGVSSTAKGVNSDYKVINDFGSVYDDLSFRRGTFAFKDLARNTDGTKINDAQGYAHYFSADVLRSNMAEGKWVMNEIFLEPSLSTLSLQGAELMLNKHFERGCKLVNIVASNVSEIIRYAPIIKSGAANWLNKPMTTIVPTQKMVVKLSELVRTSGYNHPGYISRWSEKQASGPVEIKLIEDLLGEPEINQPPVVKNPLKDYSVTSGFEVLYPIPQDAFQDPDGTIEFYEVSGLPTGVFLDKNTIKGSTTLVGNYKITVKATDMYEASTSTTFTLSVLSQKATGLTLYKAGNFLTRSLIRALKNNDTININTLNFSTNFIATPDISAKAVVMKLSGAINQTITETDVPFALFGDDGGTTLKVGSYELVLDAYNSTTIASTNGIGRTVFNFTVINQRLNQSPQIVNQIKNQQTSVNSAFSLTIPTTTFQDKDGTISRVVITGLPVGIKTNGWQISGTPTQTGSFIVSVEAFDNDNASVVMQFVLIVVAATVVNQVPIIVNQIKNQQTALNSTFSLTIPTTTFQDKDGTISRAVITGLPSGIKATGWQISGTPTQTGSFIVSVEAFDNDNASVVMQFVLTVVAVAVNQAPIATATIPDQVVIVQQPYEYDIPISLFSDVDGYVVRIIAQNIPSGLVFQNGKLSGNPTTTGDFRIAIKAVDNEGAWGETSFRLLVKATSANLPPTVENVVPNQSGRISVPFSYTLPTNIFRDPEGSSIRTEMPNLPAGLNLKNGVIFGTPAVAGEFKVTVRGYNSIGAFSETTFTLTISLANNNVPPIVVEPIADQKATAGEPFSLTIPISMFRDPDGMIFSVIVRSLPAGLVYQEGKVAGTPTTAGNYTVAVRAADNQGATVESYFVIKVASALGNATSFVFSLYKAGGSASRSFIRTLRNNDKVLLSTLPSFINIFVEASPAVDRIEFKMLGPIDVNFTDNTNPFALFDDNGGFSSMAGLYSLQVKGVKNNQAVGENTIQFTLVSGNGARIGTGEVESAEVENWQSSPNPFLSSLKITLPIEYKPTTTTFSVVNLSGQSKVVHDVKWEGQQAELNMDGLQLSKGMYLLQVQQPDYTNKSIKIIKAE